MGYRLIRLDEPVFIAVSKHLLTEFGIHLRLERCAPIHMLTSLASSEKRRVSNNFVQGLRSLNQTVETLNLSSRFLSRASQLITSVIAGAKCCPEEAEEQVVCLYKATGSTMLLLLADISNTNDIKLCQVYDATVCHLLL